MSTYVIAEVGSTHDGDYRKGLSLIEAAAGAKANAVKYQFWSDPDKLADRRRVPQQYREIYRRYRLPVLWLTIFAAHAKQLGIDFMCTAYLPEDVAVVAPYVRHFKVASFEANTEDLLKAHAEPLAIKRDAWLIVSLGMGQTLGTVGPMTDISPAQVKRLHCVSAYPAPAEALHLRRLARDRCLDGFSDHSDPALILTGALAVAAGATIVEAHLKLSDTLRDNPDALHAMNPYEFADYVRHIRFAEACVGEEWPGLQDCEREMARYRARATEDLR